MANRGTSILATELNSFAANLLKEWDLHRLPCVARAPGETRELLLVRKELAERDARIGRLEQALQHREEARSVLAAQHESLQQQLDDARSLVARVEAARVARQAAETQAQSVLAGSPTAQQLLARELQELQEAEDRAREAREQRRIAAVERKAAYDAQIEARKALHTEPTAVATAAPATIATVAPATAHVQAVAHTPTPAPPSDPTPGLSPPPPTSNTSLQSSLAAPAATLPATSPAAPSTPAAAQMAPAQSAHAAVASSATCAQAAPAAPALVEMAEPTSAEQAEAAVAEVDAALQMTSPSTVHYDAAADDEDFDTMGWPDGSSPLAPTTAASSMHTTQPPTAPRVDVESDDDAAALMMAELRAEVAHAASQPPVTPPSPVKLAPASAVPATRAPASAAPPGAVQAVISLRLFKDHLGFGAPSAHVQLVAAPGGLGAAAAPSRTAAAATGDAAVAVHASTSATTSTPQACASTTPAVVASAADLRPTPPPPASNAGLQSVAAGAMSNAATSPAFVARDGARGEEEMSDEFSGDDCSLDDDEAFDEPLMSPAASPGIGLAQAPAQPASPPSNCAPAAVDAASAYAKSAAAVEAQRHELERLQQRLQQSAGEVAVAEAALLTSSQQDEEAQRGLHDARDKLNAARQAEEARLQRVAARVPPKKGGLLRAVGIKKKAAPLPNADDAPAADLSELDESVVKFTHIAEAMQEAKAMALANAEKLRQRKASDAAAVAEAEAAFTALQAAADAQKAEAARAPTASAKPAADVSAAAGAKTATEARAAAEARPVEASASMQPMYASMPLEEHDEYDEDYGDDDVDSDFEIPEDLSPSSEVLLEDCLNLAKLYGHNGRDEPPPEDIEWDRRWVALHRDGSLWHADERPVDGVAPDGLLGRLQLADVSSCGFTMGRGDEICLSQASKCHLMRLDRASTTDLNSWLDAFAQFV